MPAPPVTRSSLRRSLANADCTAASTLAYAQETEAPLKAHTVANPFFGPLNGHQWLLYIPLHNLRHNLQIAEVKTASDYPR